MIFYFQIFLFLRTKEHLEHPYRIVSCLVLQFYSMLSSLSRCFCTLVHCDCYRSISDKLTNGLYINKVGFDPVTLIGNEMFLSR